MFLVVVGVWVVIVLLNPMEASQVGLAVVTGLFLANSQGLGKF